MVQIGDAHPTPYVRFFLLPALLRTADVPGGDQAAQSLETLWKGEYGAAEALQPLVDQCEAVAALVLDSPIPGASGGQPLRSFLGMGAAEQQVVDELVPLFQDGFHGRPPDDQRVLFRLIPAAAQLAVRTAAAEKAPDQVAVAALQNVNSRTLDLLHKSMGESCREQQSS